jgi:hypothetical protein
VVACPWPPEEDDQRLQPFKEEVIREENERTERLKNQKAA